MITLENVDILKPGYRRREPIVLGANAVFGSTERVGILATPGSGKSSLARMLSGIDRPDGGTIKHQGRVSWPIGFAGYLHPNLSVRENISNFARLVGLKPDTVAGFCREVFGIDHGPRKLMLDLSPTQRALLAYACSLSIEGPAIWIADEVITVGEPADRAICDVVLSDRLTTGGLVFLSRNVRQLTAYCDRFLVLINQRLIPCDDLAVAKTALDMAKEAARDAVKRHEHV